MSGRPPVLHFIAGSYNGGNRLKARVVVFANNAGVTVIWLENRCPLRAAATALLLFAMVVMAAGLAAAQPPPSFSVGSFTVDPQEMLDRMFGPVSPDERQRLQEIKISLSEERQLGRAAAQAYRDELHRRNITVATSGKDVAYLKRLVEQVRQQMQNAQRYPAIEVYVARSPQTDARCFPGGIIVFHSGLLEFAASEAALVGVIGHELSHLEHGHALLNLRRMKLAQQTIAAAPAVTPQQFFQNGSTWLRMFTRPYQPEDETQADHDGATWAFRCGYDPREMAALFLRLHERDQHQPAAAMPEFLRTHPFHIQRYHALLGRYEELNQIEPQEDLYIGRQNLRLRLTRSQRPFPQ